MLLEDPVLLGHYIEQNEAGTYPVHGVVVRIESLGAHVSVRRARLVSSSDLSAFFSPAVALYLLASEGFGGEGSECFANLLRVQVCALKWMTA